MAVSATLIEVGAGRIQEALVLRIQAPPSEPIPHYSHTCSRIPPQISPLINLVYHICQITIAPALPVETNGCRALWRASVPDLLDQPPATSLTRILPHALRRFTKYQNGHALQLCYTPTVFMRHAYRHWCRVYHTPDLGSLL